MEAITRGASMEELARIRYAAAAQHQAAREDQQKRSTLMWDTRTGPLHDDSGPQPPFQTSVIHKDWSEFPDHQPAPQETTRTPPEPSIWSER
jgi:hypothetical protein